jgi:hypothetical protein
MSKWKITDGYNAYQFDNKSNKKSLLFKRDFDFFI